MEAFENYLQRKGMAPRTVVLYTGYLNTFHGWLEGQGIEEKETRTADLLAYLQYLKAEKNFTRERIGRHLATLRHFFAHLREEGEIKKDPTAGLKLKTKKERLPRDILSADVLEKLYEAYEGRGRTARRNKAMLGLLIFQGLRREELGLLTPGHLDLEKGTLEIPSTRRTQGRTLALEARQVLVLAEHIREQGGEKDAPLFQSEGEGKRLDNALAKLRDKLKKLEPRFTGIGQLRRSRIAAWVRSHGLRRAQYLAGHRHVSSTERYETRDMEELRKELERYHPLG